MNEKPLPKGRLSIPRIPWKARIQALEMEMLTEAMEISEGNRSVAAFVLGICRTTLLERLKVHGLLSTYPATATRGKAANEKKK